MDWIEPVLSKRLLALTALTAAALTTVTACSSSKSSSGTNTAGGGGATTSSGSTIKLGVIADLTGASSSGFLTAEKGVKAYVEGVNASGGINGQKLSYVMADTTSTAPGALTAAQRLVQRDKVFAVIMDSAQFYGAEPYLLKQGIPVVGGAFDGPEWTVKSNTNLFASIGVIDYTKVSSATGEYMKARGVTVCGSVGYAGSVTAQKSATGIEKSCVAAGLKDGYTNTQIPFGSTDVGAIALAIKAAGVDGMEVPVVPSTGFALAAALRQLGVKLKSFLLSTGYGGDLLASSAAVTAAQGFEFSSTGLPIEANTSATHKMAADLALAGVTGPPTFAEQEAYLAVSAFAAGLKAAGANPSQKSFMTALRGVKGFDADGLMAPGKVDFDDYAGAGAGAGAAGCIFAAQLEQKKFVVVPGTPICGHTLEGVSN
jgi:branched-chain amino acid transport system substrate-binding protein